MIETVKHKLLKVLKPCPFCKSKDVLICEALENYVWCRGCGASGGRVRLANYTSKKNYPSRVLFKSVALWNRRDLKDAV